MGSTRAHAQRILLIYCSLTVVGVAALWLAGAAWLEALVHGLAAVSTGGFSSRDNSLAAFPMAVQVVATVIAAGASISLPLYWLSGRKQLRTLVTDVQLWTLRVVRQHCCSADFSDCSCGTAPCPGRRRSGMPC